MGVRDSSRAVEVAINPSDNHKKWIEVEYTDRVFKFYPSEWVEWREVYIEEWQRGRCTINGITYLEWLNGSQIPTNGRKGL